MSGEKGSMFGKATKGTVTEGASMLSKGKSTGRSGVHGNAMRSTARVEEKFSRRIETEEKRTLWRRHPKRGTPIRVRLVHPRSSSIVFHMQKMWKSGVPCRRKQGTGGNFEKEVGRVEMV